MKRWKSGFLLGVVLATAAVSVNAKAINLSNAATVQNVDGRSAEPAYVGSFVQKSYGDQFQARSPDSQIQGEAAPRERKSAVSDADLWLMLVVGAGLVLVQLRRKQKLLSQQALELHSNSWRGKPIF